MYQIFADYKNLIIFLHVISAVIWVGGMVAIRFAAHQAIQSIDTPQIKLETTVHTLRRLFAIVIIFVAFLISTGLIMSAGLGFKEAAMNEYGEVIDSYAMSLYNTVHIKEGIWLVMTLNLFLMIFLRQRAQNTLFLKDLKSTKEFLFPIARYMVPLNIILGIVAIYLGVFLRNAY